MRQIAEGSVWEGGEEGLGEEGMEESGVGIARNGGVLLEGSLEWGKVKGSACGRGKGSWRRRRRSGMRTCGMT